jgi:hypothetical protein
MHRVKIKQGITAEQVGAEKEYFEKYIKSKPLNIVYESTSGYIRVQDQNAEEWGLFKAQYKAEAKQAAALPKGSLVQDQSKAYL